MKKYILASIILSTLILNGCNNQVTVVAPPPVALGVDSTDPTPSEMIGTGVLEFSQTGNVQLAGMMTKNYRYLDSEKKEYSSGTFTDIIKAYPKTIVYFYPKDGTPNCTIQALDFSMMLADFRAH